MDQVNLISQDNLVKQVKLRNLNPHKQDSKVKLHNLNPLNQDSKVNLAFQANQVYQAMGSQVSLEPVMVMEMMAE